MTICQGVRVLRGGVVRADVPGGEVSFRVMVLRGLRVLPKGDGDKNVRISVRG